ncbi:hypothetical protein ILUMI_00161, partial [Ignelater luminosus]
MDYFKFHCAFVITLYAIFDEGYTLRCFSCTELSLRYNEVCKDALNKTVSIKECLDGQICIKHETPVVSDIPEKIVRGCAYEDYCEKKAREIEETIKTSSLHCSICKYDLCNSSTYIILSPFYLYCILL